jgi:hypothetical protein
MNGMNRNCRHCPVAREEATATCLELLLSEKFVVVVYPKTVLKEVPDHRVVLLQQLNSKPPVSSLREAHFSSLQNLSAAFAQTSKV